MLDKFKKFLTGSPAETTTLQEPVAEEIQEISPAIESLNEAQNEAPVQESLQAQIDAITAQLATANSALTKMTSKYKTAQSALAAIEASKEQLIAKAKAVKLSARKAKVELAIGTTNAASVLAATEGLEDAQFEAIVGAMAKTFEAEATSPMFQEAGIAAEAVVAVDDPVKRLAGKIAAQFKN